MLAGAAQAAQAAIGTLRFHPDTLQRALTDQALGLILPPILHISFQPPHHPDQLSSTQPSSSREAASQPQSNGESSQPQQHPQLSASLSSQQSSQHGSQQYSQQLSQQLSQQAIGESRQGAQWWRLSGGPEGAGFGGNRGSIWAMVASVGSLVPLTMQVSCILMLTADATQHCCWCHSTLLLMSLATVEADQTDHTLSEHCLSRLHCCKLSEYGLEVHSMFASTCLTHLVRLYSER